MVNGTSTLAKIKRPSIFLSKAKSALTVYQIGFKWLTRTISSCSKMRIFIRLIFWMTIKLKHCFANLMVRNLQLVPVKSSKVNGLLFMTKLWILNWIMVWGFPQTLDTIWNLMFHKIWLRFRELNNLTELVRQIMINSARTALAQWLAASNKYQSSVILVAWHSFRFNASTAIW